MIQPGVGVQPAPGMTMGKSRTPSSPTSQEQQWVGEGSWSGLGMVCCARQVKSDEEPLSFPAIAALRLAGWMGNAAALLPSPQLFPS